MAKVRGSRSRRWLRRLALVPLVAGAALLVANMAGCFSAFGQNPSGDALERISASPHYDSAKFINPIETDQSFSWEDLKTLARRSGEDVDRDPPGPIPVTPPDVRALEERWDGEGVRFTWIGHATALLEFDGFRVLTDPIWSERCSPFSFAGPERLHAPGIALDEVPEVDAVIISHDHYDHLDEPTIRELGRRGVPFHVPLGIGSHLESWGVTNYQEYDWWEHRALTNAAGEELQIHATPARHFSGRGPLDRNPTLWASWALVGPRHRVWFGGDTGYFEGFAEIGERLGPFDLTMVPIGAYDELWEAIHLNPEQAIQVHRDVRGRAMLPIHWATFKLAFHPWQEPVRRALHAASEADVRLLVPAPGQVVNSLDEVAGDAWWEFSSATKVSALR